MTEDQIVDDVFVKEGDTYGDQHSTPPIDQPTGRGGITLGTLLEFVLATRAELAPTVETLRTLSHAQAREIVRWKLRQLATHHGLDQIAFAPLRLHMIDFAYNSGAPLAIRWLQRVLGLARTGRMDVRTLAALKDPLDSQRVSVWIHQSLIAARLQMIDRATDPGGKVDHRYEEGLENRALSFSMLEVP